MSVLKIQTKSCNSKYRAEHENSKLLTAWAALACSSNITQSLTDDLKIMTVIKSHKVIDTEGIKK